MMDAEITDQTVDASTAERLRSFISRLENLEEEKKELMQNMKEVLDEAKSEGFDTKIIRKVMSLRKMKPSEREEIESLTELYLSAIER
ncbi:MAG: GapR family DNA-binding domain-containing protein [Pseudomonadota bacterium]